MSNNPISFVDPDGGWDGGPRGVDPAHDLYGGFGDKTNLQGTTVTATRLNPFFLFDGRPSSAYLFPGYVSVGNVGYDLNKVMAASIEIVRSGLANVGAGVNMPDDWFFNRQTGEMKWAADRSREWSALNSSLDWRNTNSENHLKAEQKRDYYFLTGGVNYEQKTWDDYKLQAAAEKKNSLQSWKEHNDLMMDIMTLPLGGVGEERMVANMFKREARYLFGKGVVSAAKTGANSAKSQLKAISSLEEQIAKHQAKLAEYIKDPMKFDNKDFLKNAPNDAIRQKIIQTRINHLNTEIQTFQSNIQKILNGQ